MRIFLETDRLVLRRLTQDDVDNIVQLNGDPEVMRYLTGGKPTTREVVRDQIIPGWLTYYEQYEGYGFWAAIEKATEEFLGWFHFRPPQNGPHADGTARNGIELGYRLRRSAWGKGYATEGSRALMRKGFTELGVERVYAETMTVNTGSRRVLEKAGLRYVRTFHPEWPDPIPGHEHGEVEYALTKVEWEALPNHRPGGPTE
ncbi:GNAT family N-acetyltransferase [Plantactinospora sp. DSM 117369]